MADDTTRVARLFWQKLAIEEPGHPWLKRADAQEALRNWTWREPRRVDVWWWMDVEATDGGDMVRYGRVSWTQSGAGYYDVEIHYEREGTGLLCWPSFRSLSAAQEFVEALMCLPVEEAHAIHDTQWPGVVL